MSNVLNEEKQQQVIALGRLGWSLRRIEQQTSVRRETASAYLKAAGIAVRGPGRWGRRGSSTPTDEPPSNWTAAKPANEMTTDSGELTLETPGLDPATPVPSTSACEAYRETIELGLSRGRNAMAIWQDMVCQHGFSGGYQTVKRFVRKLRGSEQRQAVGIILTAPGEEAQVDYGTGPMVRDEKSGKYRRTRLFVMTLGYSRKSVRLLVFRSSSQTWAELHEKAFGRLGGSPRVVVLDNLREGVLAADLYDPTLNPLYQHVLSHYGVVAMPCRVRDPDRKGKVESGVGHAQKTPLKGQRFESLEEAQAYLDHWEQRWADTRIHGTTKRQVVVMFAEEKPFLQTLPIEPFRYITNTATGWCISMAASKWSAPITACHPAGSAGRSKSNGMLCTCASSIPGPISSCANTCVSSQATIASTMRIAPTKLRSVPSNCWPELPRPVPTSASSARLSFAMKPSWAFAAFSVLSH
jgi:transposase